MGNGSEGDKTGWQKFIGDASGEGGKVFVQSEKGQTFKVKAESVTQMSGTLTGVLTLGANIAVTVLATAAFSSLVFVDLKFSAYYTWCYLSKLCVFGKQYMQKCNTFTTTVSSTTASMGKVRQTVTSMDLGSSRFEAFNQYELAMQARVLTADSKFGAMQNLVRRENVIFSEKSSNYNEIVQSMTSTVGSMAATGTKLEENLADCSSQVEALSVNAGQLREAGGTQVVTAQTIAHL